MEGHNPSGHCLVASKIIDYVPLSVSSSENLHPPKKQALDQTVQSTDSSCPTPELSLVGKLLFQRNGVDNGISGSEGLCSQEHFFPLNA